MGRVVLVHGFTQTARSWDVVAAALAAEGHEVAALDAPGHGARAASPAGMWDGAARLGDEGGRASYVGYSMGGRLCLHLALARPDLVTALVLVGASPGLEDEGERVARRAADEALAAEVERDGVDAFLARWLAQPLFAGLAPEAAGLDDRRRNTAAGLAASLRLAGLGTQEPLWDRLGELTMPVLLVAGERDATYLAVARRAAAAIGSHTGSASPAGLHAAVAIVAGAGHACHLERPEGFVAAVAPFLTDHA